MNIGQLFTIVNDINNRLTASGLGDCYQHLADLLEQEIDKNLVIKDHIYKDIAEIEESIDSLNADGWGRLYLEVLDKLNSRALLSSHSVTHFRGLMERSRGDYSTIMQDALTYSRGVADLNDQLNSLAVSLEPLVGGTPVFQSEELLHIYFEEIPFILDIGRLERFCRIWNSILAAFATLTGEENEVVRIYDMDSSSVTFYAGTKTLEALTGGVGQFLMRYERIVDLKRLQSELGKLRLNRGDEILGIMEEEIGNVVEATAKIVTNELLEKYGWELTDGDSVGVMVFTAIKQMLSFVENGGRIVYCHSIGLEEIIDRIITLTKTARSIVAAE